MENVQERIWLKNYPDGVPSDIDISQYDSLIGFIDQNLKKFSGSDAYTCIPKKGICGALAGNSRFILKVSGVLSDLF